MLLSCHCLRVELTQGLFRARRAGGGRAQERDIHGPHVPIGLVAPATSSLHVRLWQLLGRGG